MNRDLYLRRSSVDDGATRLPGCDAVEKLAGDVSFASRFSYDKSLLDLVLQYPSDIHIEEPLECLEKHGMPFEGSLWIEGPMPFASNKDPKKSERIGILVHKMDERGAFRFSLIYDIQSVGGSRRPSFLIDPTEVVVSPREGFRIVPKKESSVPPKILEDYAWKAGIFLSRLFVVMNKFAELRTPSDAKINKTKDAIAAGTAPLRLKPESLKALKSISNVDDLRALFGFESQDDKAKWSLARTVAYDCKRPHPANTNTDRLNLFLDAFPKVPHIIYDAAVLSTIQRIKETTTPDEHLKMLKKTGVPFQKMWIEGPYNFPDTEEEGLRMGALIQAKNDGFEFSFIKEFRIPEETIRELASNGTFIPILARATASFVVKEPIVVSVKSGVDASRAAPILNESLSHAQIEDIADHIACLLVLMGARRDLLHQPGLAHPSHPRGVSSIRLHRPVKGQMRQSALDLTRPQGNGGTRSEPNPEWELAKIKARTGIGDAVDPDNWPKLIEALNPIVEEIFGPPYTVRIKHVSQSVPIPYKHQEGCYTRCEHSRIDVVMKGKEGAAEEFLSAASKITARKPVELVLDRHGFPQIVLSCARL